MIDLDSAATTRPMDADCTEVYGNSHSIHAVGQKAASEAAGSSSEIAKAIGCRADDLHFAGSGTEANAMAILGMLPYLRRSGKDTIVISAVEHRSVLDAAGYAEKLGYRVDTVCPKSSPQKTAEVFAEHITDRVGLVCLMAVNNETGDILLDKKAAEILHSACREHGAYLFSDHIQYFPFNPSLFEHVDILTISAHKFRGPKGIGIVAVRRDVPFDDLMRGTVPTGLVSATAAALRFFVNNRPNGTLRSYARADMFWMRLRSICPEVMCNSMTGAKVDSSSIINVYFPGVDAESMVLALSMNGIMSSAGAACNSKTREASHVLMAMGFGEERAKSSVRFSFGNDISLSDVSRAADTVADTYRMLRIMSPAAV